MNLWKLYKRVIMIITVYYIFYQSVFELHHYSGADRILTYFYVHIVRFCKEDLIYRSQQGLEKSATLKEALKRIEELEKENAALREELEYYRNRKLSGRQKHNAKWMAIYNDFVIGYESGMTMVEIAKRNNVSERTIYRYKAYYDKMKKKEE